MNPCTESWDSWHLCRRACRSEYLLCWQSQVLWGRWFCTQVCLVWDTLHSRYPRQHPLNSSTCPHGISLAVARHTHPHATSCSTAHYAYLKKLVIKSRTKSPLFWSYSEGNEISLKVLLVDKMFSALTNTCASIAVQGETLSTLAAERALGVDTSAICTHSREYLTLINVYRERDILRVMTTRWNTHKTLFFENEISWENIKAH